MAAGRRLGRLAPMRLAPLSLVAVLLAVGCKKEEHTIPEGRALASAPSTSAVLAPPPAPEPPKESPADVVLTKATLADALKTTAPMMVDKPNQSSDGTDLLTIWAMKWATFEDIAPAKGETSPGKAKKDIDAERGKRFCQSGTIVQIDVKKTPRGTYYVGLLSGGALLHFHAVRSTGELVEHSGTRFCGVVTGLFDYENSGGGMGHAIDMVGMFNLPENKKP